MNVIHIDPSQPSEVEEAVQKYKDQGMVLHSTVSLPTSKVATVDGANAPLLILWRIKDQMV